MNDDGTLEDMNGVYADGFVTFTIRHQSFFFVTYDPVLLWENIFSDLSEDDLFYEAIAFMNMEGLLVGYGDGTVGSADTLTRAQFATILWRLAGEPEPEGTASFTDVAERAWFYTAVIWAAENGIVQGIGNGLFAPNRAVLRQEAAVMLSRYAKAAGLEFPENRPMTEYTDKDDIVYWAESAAKELSEAGVLPADDRLRPRDAATRGEAAELFRNFVRFVAE
jgi:hypothetical protein